MLPLSLASSVANDADAVTASDWLLYVVIPSVLVALGGYLLWRGRAAHDEATRLRGGFGGPAGSTDVGTDAGFGADADPRAAVLSAQRQMLWGGILAGVGLIWLLVGLFTQLL